MKDRMNMVKYLNMHFWFLMNGLSIIYYVVLYCIYEFLKRLSLYDLHSAIARGAPIAKSPTKRLLVETEVPSSEYNGASHSLGGSTPSFCTVRSCVSTL